MNEAINQLTQIKDALESDADQLNMLLGEELDGVVFNTIRNTEKSLRSKAHQIGEFISHAKGESEEATPS